MPVCELYGYGNVWTAPDPLFCETIAAQQKLHNWHVLPHKHADLFQLLFLESGEVAATFDGQSRVLGPGWVAVVPPMVVHEFAFRPGSGGFILTLTHALLYQLCERLALALCAINVGAVFVVGADEEDRYLAQSFHRLNDEYRNLYGPQRGPLLEALLSGILVWVHRRCRQAGQPAAEPFAPGRHLAHYTAMINDHYRSHHQVAWYARQIGVTPVHLNAIVRTMAGRSALALIHARILLEARRELTYTTRAIRAIGESLGFDDPGYFTRFFTRLAGASPKDFRARVRTSGAGAPDWTSTAARRPPGVEARRHRRQHGATVGTDGTGKQDRSTARRSTTASYRP